MYKPKIYVVDDSETTQATLQEFFTGLGCDVLSLYSAEEALVVLNSGKEPDVIILDWNLPLGMSGPAFNRKIKMNEKFEKIPVVAFTSKWDRNLRTKESIEWISSVMVLKAIGVAKVDANQAVVTKVGGDENARLIPPDLVINVAEKLKECNKPLPLKFNDALKFIRSKGYIP